MKLVTANGKEYVTMTKTEWEKMGKDKGWMEVDAKKKTPKQHGFIDQCVKENKDKKDPGAYCASIVDKVKGTTERRKGPKKD